MESDKVGGTMKRFKEERGYSLLEVIITIGLISIAIGTSTFGLRTVFNNNVMSVANEFASEVRQVAIKEMASDRHNYSGIIEYDASSEKYSLVLYIERWNGGGYDARAVYKTVKFSGSVVFTKDGTAVKDLVEDDRSFTFNAATGEVTSGGAGNYVITSPSSSLAKKVQVIQANGRVYVDG